MKPNLNRFAAALLFACAAITCSLTMWATTPGHDAAADTGKTPATGAPFTLTGGNRPAGNINPCVGEPRVYLTGSFAFDYACTNLGTVAVPFGWGGLTLKYDDPNTLLIGGNANTGNGRIYQIALTRDANNHINGFSGGPTVYPTPNATIGQFNDGGVVFGPENVLFVTRFPSNELEQSKPGSIAPDKITDLTTLGIHSSVGSIGFVPAGFPGAGSMKIASFNTGGWYHCEFVPDGNGTFNITSATLRTTLPNGAGPEGIAFVPPNSPVFPSNSVLIVDWQHGTLVTAPLDENGDPIVANTQNVIEGMGQSEGGVIDPLTGDYLFSSAGVGGKIFRVSGFATPSCTPGPWVFGHDYPFSASGAAVATDGTFAYVFGGYASGDVEHAEAYRYDPAANTWTALASMWGGPDFLCHGEYGGNGKIYVMGGVNNRAANRVYDIATNSWSLGATMPVPASYHGHVFANGKIYVIGGFVGGASSAVYAYDVATNTWSAPLAPLPQAEYETACGVINNKIYVAGGTTGTDMLNNLYIYDIATNAWTSGAPMPVGASYPGSAVVAGKLWVIGGGDPLQQVSLDNTQIYDPGTNSWSNGPTLNTARLFANAVTLNVVGGQMPMIVGGYNSTSGTELSSVEAHPPGCATPTPTPTATATASPTATATPSATATVTPTVSPTPTVTPTATATPTVTPSPTASTTPTVSPTATPTPGGCVLGQGYWKNHEQWPVNQLQLGNRTYNRQELQSILRQPPRGNGLVQLAHQEIAAKLNIANGADGSCVAQTLAAADASIGNLVIPPVGNGYLRLTRYVRTLGLYNEGGLCAHELRFASATSAESTPHCAAAADTSPTSLITESSALLET